MHYPVTPYIRKIVRISLMLIPLVVFLRGSTFAIETRVKTTEFECGKTTITINGDEQRVAMEGPISLKREDMTLKAQKGVAIFQSEPNGGNIEIKSVSLTGSVRYTDKAGYTGQCSNADYDFIRDKAHFKGAVQLSGNGMILKSDEVDYNPESQEFTAKKMVHYEGSSRHMSLLASGDKGTDVPFSVDCETITIKRLQGSAYASGGIKFKSLDTVIECDEVNLTFVDNEIVKIESAGKVTFNDPDLTANADKAIYDKSKQRLILTAGVKRKDVFAIFRGQEIRGKEVTMNLTDGREITLGEGRVNITPSKKER